MRKYLLFDLDGTLTDPSFGITNSVMYALRKFGIEENNRENLFSFIGPPLYDSFREKYDMSHDDANLAVAYYREYFAPTGLYENTVYGGVCDMLDRLKNSGRKLVLATSKPEKFACEILKHFALDGYFDSVVGATMDETRNKKEDVIAYALRELNIDPSDAVMIGDRCYDVLGGKMYGLMTVGVLYGFGDEEELSEAGADYIAATVEDLEKILVNI